MKALFRLLALVPAALAAQQSRDTVVLDPVVVTATRIPTPASAVPAAVTVISGAELRAQGIRTVAEALRTVPAASVVTTNAYGSQTSLFLRGGDADYVKVLIDGVPQNAPGGAYDFANLTTDNVDRIEVVRGPVSVLYGSDAVTGVVQVYTRDGRGAAHGSVGVGGGTYGSRAVDATVVGGAERAGYAFSVSRFARGWTHGPTCGSRKVTCSRSGRRSSGRRCRGPPSLRRGHATAAPSICSWPRSVSGPPTSPSAPGSMTTSASAPMPPTAPDCPSGSTSAPGPSCP